MIPLESVSRLTWNKPLGEKLKYLRGKVSRRELADKLKQSGYECSHQYLQKLELGDAETVSLDLLKRICEILEIPLGQVIPVVKLELPEKF
jgi:transcriptional regulator with XRE-family HTH domain